MLELKSHTLQIDSRSSNIVRQLGGGGLKSQLNFFCERQTLWKHTKDGLTF